MRKFPASFLVAICFACSGAGSQYAAPPIAELITELDAELPSVIANGNSPSIQVAVVHHDQIIWSRAYGDSTSPDTVYMNASVQKVFTATAALQLMDQGLINLDADINTYVPFAVRHPDFPEMPITVRMLLSHRSGLGSFDYQFAWDTESAFAPEYRQPCPKHLATMSQEEFIRASLAPEGANFNPSAWFFEPDTRYHYSVSAFPFLRYLVSQVAEQSYAEYMQEHIFEPLGMTNSGFSADEFAGRHATPFTRLDGENVELPIWNGRGSMMHTTAEDMAKFMLAMMNDGRNGEFQLLQPETTQLMRKRTSQFKVLFKISEELQRKGHGLGLGVFRGGWYGFGGSAPGYQTLWRYNTSRKAGYVILSNVNAILTGGENYPSARSEIYEVQDALISVLDPNYTVLRLRAAEIALIGVYALLIMIWTRWRKAKRQKSPADQMHY